MDAENVINFTPAVNALLDGLVPVALAVVSAVGYFIIGWIRANTKVKDEETLELIRQQFGAMMGRVVRYDVKKIKETVPDKLKIEVADPNVAALANYVIQQAPEMSKKLGYDVTTEAGQQAIVNLMAAKLTAPKDDAP